MNNPLQTKIDDFAKWCETAFIHFKNHYYADSLTNMRKSGEAACKLMIIYRFNEKVATDKIYQKNYRELIEMVIKDGLAPRPVINWLETLQIHGNIATHDNQVMKEQADYSITALRLLTQWLFTDFLKISVSGRLGKAINQTNQPIKTDDDSKKIEKELVLLKQDKQNLESQLRSMAGKSHEEKRKVGQLNKELKKAESNIKKMYHLRQKATLLEKELVLAHQKEKQTAKAKQSRKSLNKKILIAILTALVVIVAGWLLFNKFFPLHEETDSNGLTVSQTQDNDIFNVLILPLTILQDNPNIRIKLEEALQSRIRQNIKERKLPINICYDASLSKTSLSVEDAVEIGKSQKAGLVFYGELYEPATADSIGINLKYTLTHDENRNYGDITVKSFLKLTDTAFLNIQYQVETVIDFALADLYMSKRKYSDALALLYTTKAITKCAKTSLYNFLAACHFHLKDYPTAIKEIEKYMEIEPGDSYAYAFMANVLKGSGNLQKASENYEISLRLEPNNVNTLLNYADLLTNETIEETYNLHKSKELVLKALKYDSANTTGWQYLGDIENMMGNYAQARDNYLKCLRLDSTCTYVKQNLAQIFAFNFHQPKKAEKLLSEILQKDSTDASALFLLANIYTTTSLKKPDMAQYLFKKSELYRPDAKYSHYFGKGMAAYKQADFKTAEEHYLSAFAIDSSDIVLSNCIAQLYLDMRNYQKALRYLGFSYRIDSMSHMTNYNMGFIYYAIAKKGSKFIKAKYYFERALKTNPYDTLNIKYLATIHYLLGNLKRSEELFLQLLELSPSNYICNKYLGAISESNGKLGKALLYYEKALKVSPNDDELYSKLAYLMMAKSTNNLHKALPYARKAVELNPESANNIYILSQVLVYANNYSEASNYYYQAISMSPSLRDPNMEKVLKQAGY
jgi:tetratricopeptide (TPR) repeat protein